MPPLGEPPPDEPPPDEPPPPNEPPPRDEPLRELPVRDRVPVLRERALVLRVRDVLADFLAPPVDRDDADLLAPDERLEPEPDDFAPDDFPPDDFALDDALRVPPVERELEPALRDDVPLERLLVERDLDAALRDPVDRDPDDELRDPVERPPLLRDEDALEPPLLPPPLEPSLADHLPVITRCAASATASAINAPSLVALDMTFVAACDAVSAASRPASRIFLRAAGLALIAAAAAARPAASISLLIAAFASLSTVDLSLERDRDDDDLEPDDFEPDDFDDEEREELLRADFAIFYLPPSWEKTL